MVNSLTKEAKAYNGVKTGCSIDGVGKIGQVRAQYKTRPRSRTTYKNKLKAGERLTFKV